MVADAVHSVGKDGAVSLEDSNTPETTLKVIEGYVIDRGYMSPYFATDVAKMEVAYTDCLVLCVYKRISSIHEILPLMNYLNRSQEKMLLIVEDIDETVFGTIVANSMKKSVNLCLVKSPGFVETIFGRKRFLADINSQNSIVRGYAERNAINAPIQGSAADIIKIAMVKIQSRLDKEQLRTTMTMQVHDELNFNVPASEIEVAKKIVVDEMESAIKLQVPLIADCGVGANWLEAH
jgi:ribosomal protein L7Ae-like RNA K-turn-binding protein